LMPGALSGWTSAIIRATHPSLPSIIGFPSLYGRLRVNRVAALMVILLILGSTQVSSFAGAFQRSLSREPVDRLSLDYKAPYYRMYLLAGDSGKTLVFGGLHMRGIRMYMAMLPNAVLVPVGERETLWALSEAGFRAWLEKDWDSIYLYDDWVTIQVPSMIDAYPPFYSEILRSRQYPGYSVEMLWIDGESYALKMTRAQHGSGVVLQSYSTSAMFTIPTTDRIRTDEVPGEHTRVRSLWSSMTTPTPTLCGSCGIQGQVS